MLTISENELSPLLHYARSLEISHGYSFNGILAYEARMLYVQSGSGAIEISGTRYPLSVGTLICWQAGSRYGFTELSGTSIRAIMLNFDFIGELGAAMLRNPAPPEEFDFAQLESTASFIENADERGVFIDRDGFWAESLMRELLNEYRARQFYSESAARGIITLLTARLSRNMLLGDSASSRRSDEIIDYINEHISEKLTYESLGRVFSYHPNHLSRIINKATGLPLHRYLLRLRIEKAYGLLTDSGLSVAETAALCGFADAASFAKRFKREIGLTPSEVRRGRG